jgi:hypothetical protein
LIDGYFTEYERGFNNPHDYSFQNLIIKNMAKVIRNPTKDSIG